MCWPSLLLRSWTSKTIELDYQTLEFKVIKELKTAVAQYDLTAPFTQALLDTVMGVKFNPTRLEDSM